MDAFVDRDAELRRLTDCYESTAAELAVVYGRRRLGKTELVKQSIADRDGVVFYQAREKTKTLQLDQFASAAAETYPGIERIQQEWEPLLGYLAEQDAIVVLDEFPYLIAEDESLPSVLQAMFDHEMADSRYFSILEAVAGGATTRNEIAGVVGVDTNQLSKYLDRLERLRLIERHVPITEQPERSRRGRYRLRDPLFRFWFRFVYGSGTRYDAIGPDSFEQLIEPELADFISPVYERLCGAALRNLYPEYTITDVGQWWYQDHEIDVVGFTTGNTLLVGECKFQSAPTGYDALATLESHTDELRWTPPSGGERDCEYALFSRSGFEASVREAADSRDDLRLIDLNELVAAVD